MRSTIFVSINHELDEAVDVGFLTKMGLPHLHPLPCLEEDESRKVTELGLTNMSYLGLSPSVSVFILTKPYLELITKLFTDVLSQILGNL